MRRQSEFSGYSRYLRRLSSERRRNAVALLGHFANLLGLPGAPAELDWASVIEHDYAEAVQAVQRACVTRTANALRSHIQAVLQEEHRMGHLSGEQLAALRRAWEEPAKGSRGQRSNVASSVEGPGALLAVCERDCTPRGARDGALIALIWALRLGPTDIVKLPLNQELWSLMGSQKEPALQWALHRWLDLRGDFPGPTLLSIHRQGRIRSVPMTRTTVTAAIRQRSREAGIGDITSLSLIAASALSTQAGQ